VAVVEEAPEQAAPPPGGDPIAYRLRQQRILAEFGMDALRSRDVGAMLQRATELCARGMASHYCKFLSAPDGEQRMLVEAGVGWDRGVVGCATLGGDLASPAGFAFKTGEAVISNHLDQEERFRTPDLMAEHGIRRAINVLVEADGKRYGVLEVDSPSEGKFDEDDLAFMQGFANLIGVAIERQHAEAKLAEAVEHQKLLTREASHRVKNSLALVSAMLNLQMTEDDDPRVQRLLGDAQARITAIAQAHDQLWRGERVGLVMLDELVCGLAESLNEQAANHAISCNAEPIVLSADSAIPRGLLVTELVTNAVKYAYPQGEGGPITIDVSVDGGDIVMRIEDQGQGLPTDFDPHQRRPASLGMRMIASLSRQLDGSIDFAGPPGAGGTTVTFRFPRPDATDPQ
jgi:two-component sensor histidine kinase